MNLWTVLLRFIVQILIYGLIDEKGEGNNDAI